MPITSPVYAAEQRRLNEEFLDFYQPSDIRQGQEILVKNRFTAKIQLPATTRTLLAAGAVSGVLVTQAFSASSVAQIAGAGVGAAAGAGAAAGLRALNVLQDEFDLTLLDSFSIDGITGGEVIKRVDGGSGLTYLYHSNKKEFGKVNLVFFRERDKDEYQRIITLFHLFINFGLKCNMIVEKYTLDKQIVTEFILQGVCFNNLKYDELNKSEGGAWKFTLTGDVGYFQERIKTV